ncbi:transposase [Wolbachia pipientis]|uniref:transposase n=1 Tax=Wolbachia pipientis TaxID=955 RepID=UPI0020B7A215|nr:transposase [Wolbachia pipientis]
MTHFFEHSPIRYMMRTGYQWRQLPKDFPPWKTVYSCNSRLKKKWNMARNS